MVEVELETLAPLHVLLDPEYPANLREVAEILFVQLLEEEPRTADADGAAEPLPEPRVEELAQLALRQTGRLSTAMGGRNFYMGKGVSYRASVRDRELYARFNGRNYDELARSAGLTEMRIRQIISAMHMDELGRRQGRLDL